MDTIIDAISGEIATIVVGIVLAGLSALAGLALDALRKRLGEERTDLLRDRLGEAIDRAIAAAETQGVTRADIEDRVAVYIASTMADTIHGLGASPEALANRVSAQVADRLGPST